MNGPHQCGGCSHAVWRTDSAGVGRVAGCCRFGVHPEAPLLGLLLMDMATRMPCPARDAAAAGPDAYLSRDLPAEGVVWP